MGWTLWGIQGVGLEGLGCLARGHRHVVGDVVRVKNRAWAWADPNGRAAAGGGDTVPGSEPELLLGVLWAGDRDAELVGLGGGAERGVGEDGGTAHEGPRSGCPPPWQFLTWA
jgi:hypothetical protein